MPKNNELGNVKKLLWTAPLVGVGLVYLLVANNGGSQPTAAVAATSVLPTITGEDAFRQYYSNGVFNYMRVGYAGSGVDVMKLTREARASTKNSGGGAS